METSHDYRQSSAASVVIEPSGEDISLMTVNDAESPTLNEELLMHPKEALVEECGLPGERFASNDDALDRLPDEQHKIGIGHDKNSSNMNNEELLVELDSEVDNSTSNPHSTDQPEEGATSIVQDSEIGRNDSYPAAGLDTSLKDSNTAVLNEDSSRDTSHLLSSAKERPQQSDSNTELCRDSNVRLVYVTLHKPTELILLFKLTNHCQARVVMEKVSMATDPPSNLVAVSSKSMAVDTLAFLETVSFD